MCSRNHRIDPPRSSGYRSCRSSIPARNLRGRSTAIYQDLFIFAFSLPFQLPYRSHLSMKLTADTVLRQRGVRYGVQGLPGEYIVEYIFVDLVSALISGTSHQRSQNPPKVADWTAWTVGTTVSSRRWSRYSNGHDEPYLSRWFPPLRERIVVQDDSLVSGLEDSVATPQR